MSTIPIACLGLSHETAPLELREQLRCTLTDLDNLIRPASGCQRFGGCSEYAVLSTCNRVEVLACMDPETVDTRLMLSEILTEATGIDVAHIPDYFYHYTGTEAVEHLCRVASGLESLVLGEQQVLGQVSDAYQQAASMGTAGTYVAMAYRIALRAGKKSRTQTSISHNPASMSSVAIAHAQKRAGNLAERCVLVVGLGEMGHLTLKALKARGIKNVLVANRTLARARAAAKKYDYEAVALSDVGGALARADVVITATASPDIIITRDMVREAATGRDGRELVLVDIAVPRNVDPSAGDVPRVSLCDTGHLQGTLDEALSLRKKEVPRVEEVIKKEIASLENALRGLTARPLITELRQKAESIRQQELKRAMHRLGDVDPQTLEQIQYFSRSLVNKLLHGPTARLKEEAANGHAEDYEVTVRALFGLPEDREGSLR